MNARSASVVYSALFEAVLASIPAVSKRMAVFDTDSSVALPDAKLGLTAADYADQARWRFCAGGLPRSGAA
jgi:hypothetical protein